jgi:branched-subunit amino acid aminotransferase/4-amino-4-deoxychorismate lyase
MTTVDGWISETTIANIFWLKEDVVFTPSEACDILPGITRRIILGLLKNQLNIAVKEGTFGMDEIKNAELVFICNSVKEIVPIAGIDETQFDTRHPLLEKMQSCFKAYRNRQLSAEV